MIKESVYGWVLNLANLYGIEIEEREINGQQEQVLVIPIRHNNIYVNNSKKYPSVRLYGKCLPVKNKAFGKYSHFITLSRSVECQKLMKSLGWEDGKKMFPIIGNLSVDYTREIIHKQADGGDINKLDKIL